MNVHRKLSSGFSIVEGLAVVAVVVIIGAVGYVFFTNYMAPKNNETANSNTPKTSAPAGTAASIEQATTSDAEKETTIDTEANTEAKQSTNESESTVTNVGGAYDENNL